MLLNNRVIIVTIQNFEYRLTWFESPGGVLANFWVRLYRGCETFLGRAHLFVLDFNAF
jgi:hypothetical protein